jgi:hypothetical protein
MLQGLHTPTGFFVIADRAFPSKSGLAGKIKTPMKRGQKMPNDQQQQRVMLHGIRPSLSVRLWNGE